MFNSFALSLSTYFLISKYCEVLFTLIRNHENSLLFFITFFFTVWFSLGNTTLQYNVFFEQTLNKISLINQNNITLNNLNSF